MVEPHADQHRHRAQAGPEEPQRNEELPELGNAPAGPHAGRQGDATAMGISSLYAVFAAALVLALALRPWALRLPQAVALTAGLALFLVGLALAAAGMRPFCSSARLFGVERGGLIEGGVYRFSRNPQYAGLALVVVGVALAARSGLALALAALFSAGMWFWVVAVEEPHLRKAFGPRYAGYEHRVPRFIGLPREPPR